MTVLDAVSYVAWVIFFAAMIALAFYLLVPRRKINNREDDHE